MLTSGQREVGRIILQHLDDAGFQGFGSLDDIAGPEAVSAIKDAATEVGTLSPRML